MWPFTPRADRKERVAYVASSIRREPTKGQQLRLAQDDRERAELSAQWAAEARYKWYQGQREKIEEIVLSESVRYRGLPPYAREMIGRKRWGISIECKDLTALEEMYTRWADHYTARADWLEGRRSA